MEYFKNLGVLFTSGGREEQKIDRLIGAAVTVHCCEARAEHKSKTIDLSFALRPNFHLWSQALCCHKNSDHKYK